MVILWHDTAGIFSPVPAGFILLPGGPGKPFKQGTPTSAVQLEPVWQPPYRTWDMTTLNWNEKGRMNLQLNSFKSRSTMIQFTNDFPQWKWKDVRVEVQRVRQGESMGVSLHQYSEERKEERKIVNSQKVCEGEALRGIMALNDIKQVNSSQKVWNDQEGLKNWEQIDLLVDGIQDKVTTRAADMLKSWPYHQLLLTVLEQGAHPVHFKMYIQYEKCKTIIGHVWKQEIKSSHKSEYPDEDRTTQLQQTDHLI